MIVPADAAVITNGRPYVGRVTVRTAVVVVAKFPLQSRHVERFLDQTPCLLARPGTSHHLALWSARLSRASAERRQLARPLVLWRSYARMATPPCLPRSPSGSCRRPSRPRASSYRRVIARSRCLAGAVA